MQRDFHHGLLLPTEAVCAMKYFYWFIAAALVVTVVAVVFVPGVDDLVEQVFQRYLGRAAR